MPTDSILAGLLHFGSIVMLAVGALLPIVDPLGGAPIYLAMTSGLSSMERARMAKSVAVNSFLLLIASALAGAYVLDFFGLSIPSVQVAGGIVVCLVAWSLLNSPNSQPVVDHAARKAASAEDLSQRAFYPMTLPLTVGPGSISVALTLGANPPLGLRQLLLTALAHTAGILLVALGVYYCYRYADRILRTLGATGTNVVVRLTAFILLCIGVQICWNGFTHYWPATRRRERLPNRAPRSAGPIRGRTGLSTHVQMGRFFSSRVLSTPDSVQPGIQGSLMSVMEHSVSIASTTAVVPAGNQIRIVSVLQRVLAESMRLIELHKHVRWQISGSRLSKIRKLLDEHHKEQRSLLGLLVERLHALGGTDPVLADSSAQSAKVCRVIRGPIALHQLLRALLEAHEAVLRAAKPGNTHDDRSLVRDFAVGRAVLTNEQQWEIISGEVRRAGPQQRLIQADSSRLDE